MKAHRVPTMEKEIGKAYSHFKKKKKNHRKKGYSTQAEHLARTTAFQWLNKSRKAGF